MGELTLKELCSIYNVSRRAVQGYETSGLLIPTRKNEYGHLLYDESAQQRVKKIKQFQRFGFQIKEIVNVMDASNDILIKELEHKLVCLQSEQSELVDTIIELKSYIESLENPL